MQFCFLLINIYMLLNNIKDLKNRVKVFLMLYYLMYNIMINNLNWNIINLCYNVFIICNIMKRL